MVPRPELFRHRSTLHGQAHVARVMVHAMRLIEATGKQSYGPQLWASVFLHDLARTHDGECHRHGADAAQRLRDEPGLQQRLTEAGLVEADYPAIEAAVTAHSAPKEVSRDNPHWPRALRGIDAGREATALAAPRWVHVSDFGGIELAPAKVVLVEDGFRDGVRRTVVPTHIFREIKSDGNDCPTAEVGASPLPSCGEELDSNFKIGMLHGDPTIVSTTPFHGG